MAEQTIKCSCGAEVTIRASLSTLVSYQAREFWEIHKACHKACSVNPVEDGEG